MRPLNDELNVKDGSPLHLLVASNDRAKSSLREDVKQTTDLKAYNEMLEYCKSDPDTLDRHKDSEVAAFYKGRCVLITGASGFVGKCLLEKLLRSCPDLKTVFILMRPKRGHGIAERVEELVRSPLFDRLRASEGGSEQMAKIVAVKGDITEPLFGLSPEDLETMRANVTIIFHSAATVKFIEPLNVAVENNVISVEHLIELASRLPNLEALVHVSTAYSNCDRKRVDEVFYEKPIDAEKLIDMAKWMDSDTLNRISPILVGKRPNTYTFTKAVAESLLMERSKKLLPNIPIAMVRPSIVAGIWRQPICGWVDNFNGPTGVILSLMTGAIQAMLACPNYCADIIPVDIVANLIICTAWQVVCKKERDKRGSVDRQSRAGDDQVKSVDDGNNDDMQSKDISIFNCVSGTLNPIAWGDFAKYILQVGCVYPPDNIMRRPGTLLISNKYLFSIYNFLNHTLFAYTGDFCMRLAGNSRPNLVIIYKRLMKMIDTLKPFTTNQWLFDCSNVKRLYEQLTPIDKEIFNFDIRQVRWDEYLRKYYVGSKIYALKDDPNKVVKARHKLRKIKAGSQFVQILFLSLAYYILLSGSSLERCALDFVDGIIKGLVGIIDEQHSESQHHTMTMTT